MAANVDSATGIPYGVFDPRSFQHLFDDIWEQGDDLTYLNFKKELGESVRSALVGVISDSCHGDESATKIVDTGIDVAELVEGLLDAGLNDLIDFEEGEHEFEEHSIHYYQGWLGGAPLVWVTKSTHVAYAPGCSPCVPGAGNLDAGWGEDGIVCYSPSPEVLNESQETKEWEFYVEGELEIRGVKYGIVRRKPIEKE